MSLYTQIASYVVLLGVSAVLGFIGRPTEMALAVTAGFLGLVFANLEKFAKFKGGGFEAELREQLQAVVEKETEPDAIVTVGAATADGYGLVGEDAPKIIRALFSEKYAWRYASGISKETGVLREEVQSTLDWLDKNDLGKSSRGKTGRIWALTAKGRDVFAEYRI